MTRVLVNHLNWLKVKLHFNKSFTEFSTEIAGIEETDGIFCYNVDNKYYSAVITLCCDDVSAEEADAILVIIDINKVVYTPGAYISNYKCLARKLVMKVTIIIVFSAQ